MTVFISICFKVYVNGNKKVQLVKQSSAAMSRILFFGADTLFFLGKNLDMLKIFTKFAIIITISLIYNLFR